MPSNVIMFSFNDDRLSGAAVGWTKCTAKLFDKIEGYS